MRQAGRKRDEVLHVLELIQGRVLLPTRRERSLKLRATHSTSPADGVLGG